MAVELRGITKRYGRVLANDHVCLRVRQGEIHAIVGENGAGKSTLMKILAGVTRPDGGDIFVNGTKQYFSSPQDAIRVGVGMVFQHFRLVQDFTVAENVLLGRENSTLLRPERMRQRVSDLADRYGVEVRPDALVESLSVGEQQRVEILKVLYREAKVIILDEPTAVLTPAEVEKFFATVRALRDSGTTIILITHKLQEVMAICDRVTVLRDGRVAGECKVADTSAGELAALMVGGTGGAIDEERWPADEAQGEWHQAVLEVRGIIPQTVRGRTHGRGVSFEVGSGEIVGVAGVEGNGQSELVEALVGLRRVKEGMISFAGKNISDWSVKARRRAGIAFIPEDRQRHGLVLNFTLAENLMLGRHFKETRLAGTSKRSLTELLQAYDVRPAEPARRARELSGGNQQKLVIARELSRGAPLLVASQPTRGVDLGAVEAIHEHLRAQRAAGAAVLLVSSDLEEILSLADRVLVMYKGTVVFKAPNVGLDEQLLGWYMAGGDTAVERGGGA